jgi:preprotein translocase subunit Sec61beta
LGGLAAAGTAATLLNFFHPYDATVSDIVIHAIAVALVVGANRLFGERLFR